MNEKILVLFAIFAVFGYVVLHGHRLNQDCWMCQYRGLTMVGGSLTTGWFFAVN